MLAVQQHPEPGARRFALGHRGGGVHPARGLLEAAAELPDERVDRLHVSDARGGGTRPELVLSEGTQRVGMAVQVDPLDMHPPAQERALALACRRRPGGLAGPRPAWRAGRRCRGGLGGHGSLTQ